MSSITYYCGIVHLLTIFSCVLVCEGGLLDFLDLGPHNNDGDDAMDDGGSSQQQAVIEFPSLNEMSSTERHANRQRARKVATIIEKNIHMLANDLLQMWTITRTEGGDSDDSDLEAFAKQGRKFKKAEPPATARLDHDSTEGARDTPTKEKISNTSEDSGGGPNKESRKPNHELGTTSIKEEKTVNTIGTSSESTEETKDEMTDGDSVVKTKDENSKLTHDSGPESMKEKDNEKEGNTAQVVKTVVTKETGAAANNDSEEKTTEELGEKSNKDKEEKSAEEIESISSEGGHNEAIKDEEPKTGNKEEPKITKDGISTDSSYTPSRDDLIMISKIESSKATEGLTVKTPNEIESGLVKEIKTTLSNGKGTEISIEPVNMDIEAVRPLLVKEEVDNTKQTTTELTKEARGKVGEDIKATSSNEEGTKTTKKLEKVYEEENGGDTIKKITATPSKKVDTVTTEGFRAESTKETASKPTEVGAESIRKNEEVTTKSLGSESKVDSGKESISADKGKKDPKSLEANLKDGTEAKSTKEYEVMQTRNEHATDKLNESNITQEEKLSMEGQVNSTAGAKRKSMRNVDNDAMEEMGTRLTSKTSNFNQGKLRPLRVGRKLSKKRRALYRKKADQKKQKKWMKRRKNIKPKRKPRRGKYVKSKHEHDRIH